MTDMTRTDWANEAWSPSEETMEAADKCVRQEVRDLLSSLLSILPAVGRSELDTVIKRLGECEAYHEPTNEEIRDAIKVIESYRDERDAKWQRGVYSFNTDAFANDLEVLIGGF